MECRVLRQPHRPRSALSAGALGVLALVMTWGQIQASGVSQDVGEQSEAQKWQDVLRRQGALDGERLAVLTPDGELIHSLDGGRSRVSLPPRLGPLIGDPARPVIFVHNHPLGHGLSADDVGMLSAPGLRQVIAVGHEGSVYNAAVGSRAEPFRRRVPLPVFSLASHALSAALKPARDRYDRYVRRENQAHLVALVLARAELIDYRASLGRVRALGWEANQEVFERAIDLAAQQLLKRLSEPPAQSANPARGSLAKRP